jgi:parallel beta-helix repeat protein
MIFLSLGRDIGCTRRLRRGGKCRCEGKDFYLADAFYPYMNRKVVAIWVSLLIIVSSVVILVEIAEVVEAPTTWYVDDEFGSGPGNPPQDFYKIQDAIDAASPGDTVIVYNGTYWENVNINHKTINLVGENRNSTIIHGVSNWNVVQVSGIWSNVTGFTIINSGENYSGILLKNAGYCNISCNNISQNDYGIVLDMASWNSIIENYVSFNKWAFTFDYSSNNTIIKNNVSNGISGFDLDSSPDCILEENIVTFNKYHGFVISGSRNTILRNNLIASNNGVGVYIIGTVISTLIDNYIYSNKQDGINVISSLHCMLRGNTFINGGLYLYGDQISYYDSHNISTDNIVNNKPLYYYTNQSHFGVIDKPVGQLFLINCSNVTVNNLQINNTAVGIEVAFSDRIYVTDNSLNSNKRHGCMFLYSSNSTFLRNNMSYNSKEGIYFISGFNNSIKQNNIVSNLEWGIMLYDSSNNNIEGNNIISNNEEGIFLNGQTTNNIISVNNIMYNGYGLFSSGPPGISNRIYHNNFVNNEIQAFDNWKLNLWNDTYPSGGNFWSDYDGIDLKSTSLQNVPPPDSIGDTPYMIDSDSKDNYPLMLPYGNYTFLRKGWNLISIPFIQSDTEVDQVLSSLIDSYDSIQWFNTSNPFDRWSHNHKNKPSILNDFKEIDHSIGFWIFINDPNGTLFEYPGTPPPFTQTIQLYEGWNMVGYPSLTNHNRTVGLNNLEFGVDVDAIQWYDTPTKTWHFMDQDDSFVPGRGYWVHSKVEAGWEVPL